jgi:two-component system sensor histidine kinase TctE
MADPRRIGIRALLLAMLLPGIVALLLLDAWNDYRTISRVVVDAYDQSLIEPVQALNDSVTLGADGAPHVDAAFSVEAMFEATRPRFKHLRVGFARVPFGPQAGAQAGSAPVPTSPVPALPEAPEETLAGVSDLPPPPPGPDDKPVFYDAVYRGYPVRIAALRRTLQVSNTEAYRIVSQAAESTGARQQALADSWWHNALWNDARVVGVMVVLVWLGVALALRPLERLRRSLVARAPNDRTPLDARGVPYEVAPLVESVNHHIANQGRLLAEQSRFLADASHQLRTPLAIMLTQAGYALREREAAPMRETLHAIVAQLVRTRRLSEQLLALAHASNAAPDATSEGVCDLNAVAREVVLQHLPLAHEKNQDLGWVDARGEADDDVDDDAGEGIETPPGAAVAPVAASGIELHEVLSNLVHNAIKYTPAGGRITVAVRLAGASAEAEVSDTGPGIPAGLRAAAFERFRRNENGGDAAGNRGAGLGLAIADAYARRNGGVIELGDAPAIDGLAGGLRATLRLPLAG